MRTSVPAPALVNPPPPVPAPVMVNAVAAVLTSMVPVVAALRVKFRSVLMVAPV